MSRIDAEDCCWASCEVTVDILHFVSCMLGQLVAGSAQELYRMAGLFAPKLPTLIHLYQILCRCAVVPMLCTSYRAVFL